MTVNYGNKRVCMCRIMVTLTSSPVWDGLQYKAEVDLAPFQDHACHEKLKRAVLHCKCQKAVMGLGVRLAFVQVLQILQAIRPEEAIDPGNEENLRLLIRCVAH